MRKYSGFAGDGPLRPGRFAAGILLGAALGGCATQPVAPPAPLPMAPPASDPVPMTATPAAAPMRETVRLRENGAGRYVVKKGDTLWGTKELPQGVSMTASGGGCTVHLLDGHGAANRLRARRRRHDGAGG